MVAIISSALLDAIRSLERNISSDLCELKQQGEFSDIVKSIAAISKMHPRANYELQIKAHFFDWQTVRKIRAKRIGPLRIARYPSWDSAVGNDRGALTRQRAIDEFCPCLNCCDSFVLRGTNRRTPVTNKHLTKWETEIATSIRSIVLNEGFRSTLSRMGHLLSLHNLPADSYILEFHGRFIDKSHEQLSGQTSLLRSISANSLVKPGSRVSFIATSLCPECEGCGTNGPWQNDIRMFEKK